MRRRHAGDLEAGYGTGSIRADLTRPPVPCTRVVTSQREPCHESRIQALLLEPSQLQGEPSRARPEAAGYGAAVSVIKFPSERCRPPGVARGRLGRNGMTVDWSARRAKTSPLFSEINRWLLDNAPTGTEDLFEEHWPGVF